MNLTKYCCTIVLGDIISTIVVSYGMFAQILMDIILKNFKKALRFVISDFKSSYCKLFDKCNKQPLYIVRIYLFIEMIYQIINHSCSTQIAHQRKTNVALGRQGCKLFASIGPVSGRRWLIRGAPHVGGVC